jgi:hypothetical protein
MAVSKSKPLGLLLAVDGDRQRRTDLTHASVGEPADSLDEHGERNALDRIQVDRITLWDRIVARL